MLGLEDRCPEKLQAKLLSLSMLCKRKWYACGLALCHKHRYFQGNETETHFTWDLSHLLLLLCSFVCITEEKCGKTVCFSPDMPSHVGEFRSANIRNIGKAVSCWGGSKKKLCALPGLTAKPGSCPDVRLTGLAWHRENSGSRGQGEKLNGS